MQRLYSYPFAIGFSSSYHDEVKLSYIYLVYSRWDSSDPERAPPPLPLNPGTSSPVTKPNTTSTLVLAAAESLAARARETTARESNYITNPSPARSPEKSLIKGQYHKRMQSFQNGNGTVRDRGSLAEGAGSPTRSPERLPRTPSFDQDTRSLNRSSTRSGTPTPSTRDFGRDTPILRPTPRSPIKPILGENTPPSATMLAIQNMPAPKDTNSSLSDVTHNSFPTNRNPQTFDALSSQILSLTSIATNLQREMAQLSRRSKDNATDLISLKEATNSRDEDIRKSLRDLATNLSSRLLSPAENNPSRTTSRYGEPGPLFLDSKAHVSPPGMSKSYSMPRIASPNAFAAALDREVSPAPYSTDGAATIALLEKIFREMATKEGQERVMSSLSELQGFPNSADADTATVKKLEEILTFLKDGSTSRALVPHRDKGHNLGQDPPKLELDFDPMPKPLAPASKATNPVTGREYVGDGGKPLLNDDILNLLKKMKDSITEGGCLTAETKALVRELRGEVLGMGREIGRKLEQAETTRGELNTRDDARGPGREEIARIVEEGLADLKDHMDNVMREKRRQSSSSAISRTTAESQEVYTAVKNALAEIPFQQQLALQQSGSGIEREEILEAVREAWETYKPEIELQNFGLERDEILECLKEGLQQYQPGGDRKNAVGVSYDEVLDAVREALQGFKPPSPIENEASVTREELLMTVRECLESIEFPVSQIGTSRETEITREDVLDAVKEGLSTQAPISKEIEFNRSDLFEAVRAGLEGAATPMGGLGEQVLEKMQDLSDGMRLEFKQYSAANGGDTEQVLDALKDGLEILRADVESYVDRAADVTGKDEIVESMRDGLESLRNDLEKTIAKSSQDSSPNQNGEMLDAMEREFEHLRQSIATTMLRSEQPTAEREELLSAIRDGFENLRPPSRDATSDPHAEGLQNIKEEFAHLREILSTALVRGSASFDKEEVIDAVRENFEAVRGEIERRHERPESVISNTGEILDAMNDGLDSLRADVEKMVNRPLDMTVNYEILDTLKEGLAGIRADVDRLYITRREQDEVSLRRGGEVVIADPDAEAERLRRNDIENLEMMITQLRIKVEALDSMPPAPPQAPPAAEGAVSREDIDRLEGLLQEVQASVVDNTQRERTTDDDLATKTDAEAIETLLRNTKAKIDELSSVESEGLARVAHLEALENVIKDARDVMTGFGSDAATKEDTSILEAILKEVRFGLEEMRDRIGTDNPSDQINKTDIEALEALCLDTKTQLSELILPDVDTLPTKSEVRAVEDLVKGFEAKLVKEAENTALALGARKEEHEGLADLLDGLRAFVDEVRHELKSKIKDGNHGIEDLTKTLEGLMETVVSTDATEKTNEILEAVKNDFKAIADRDADLKEDSHQRHTAVLEKHDEHRSAIISELQSKIDDRFDEIMTKFDDAQLAAEAKEKAIGSKDQEQAEALNATRNIAEDLRVLIDTLGPTFTESCDRIGEDSKTVFNRIEDLGSKLDELLLADMRVEHQATRAEISKTLTSVEGVQAHASEYYPKILEAVQDVLSIVGQHYEQAKTSAEEIKTSVNAIPNAIPLPAIAAPMPSPELPKVMHVPEKYDDSELHSKLDHLIQYATDAGKTDAQVALLEQIKEQVAASASEFNAFIATQQARISEGNEAKAKEAEEVALALHRRSAQKEGVEADIVRLSDEKALLTKQIVDLALEKEDLMAQKSRFQADLSSLHTALDIRREELSIMEARAEGLERRILDGVLDHSRSLLTTSRPSSLKNMNVKRVPSSASNVTTVPRTSTTGTGTRLSSLTTSAISSGVGMAVNRRPPPRSNVSNTSNKSDRRILSLSTLGANKGPGAERSMVLANPTLATKGTGFGGPLKRSHSVKSNFPVRKASWGGTKALGMYADEGAEDEDDKENSILELEDEGSEAGTERRTSFSGTYADSLSYGDGSMVSSHQRQPSYAISTIGTVGTRDLPLMEAEEGKEDEEESEHVSEESEIHADALGAKGEISNAAEMVVFEGHGSDSGLGTELPTAQLEGGGSDYFGK